jgi:mono/diheme cytochrome c family protein
MRGWSVQLCVVYLLSSATLTACGGERRSGSVPGNDTVGMPDTAASVVRDTAPRRDSVVASAPASPGARTTPAPKPASKPQAKPAAPKSAPASDTATAATPESAAATPAPSGGDAPLRDAYHQAPVDTVAPAVYDGWKQFNLNCARCHGEDVQGTTIAPHLIVSLRPDGPINTKELFVQTVCAGRLAKGMPAWCALGMDMSTIESIYSYVKGRSDGKIHPGRPARREG